jgi:hypothetical protein
VLQRAFTRIADSLRHIDSHFHASKLIIPLGGMALSNAGRSLEGRLWAAASC